MRVYGILINPVITINLSSVWSRYGTQTNLIPHLDPAPQSKQLIFVTKNLNMETNKFWFQSHVEKPRKKKSKWKSQVNPNMWRKKLFVEPGWHVGFLCYVIYYRTYRYFFFFSQIVKIWHCSFFMSICLNLSFLHIFQSVAASSHFRLRYPFQAKEAYIHPTYLLTPTEYAKSALS